MKKTNIKTIFLGCDPEFFLEDSKGEVKASEECIPEKGCQCTRQGFTGKVIRDGVQIELNPQPQTCRQQLGYALAASLAALEHSLSTGMTISKRAVVDVPKNYLDSLSPETRALGCAPSLNGHNSIAITEAQKSTTTRSAGGHLHLGLDRGSFDPKELVTMLDQFVGNTSVLIDRDPEQKKRRELYGRAGEYRLPAHGLEYRTPSNYWMISFQMASFITGLARQTCSFMARKNEHTIEKEIEYWDNISKSSYTSADQKRYYKQRILEIKAGEKHKTYREDYDEMTKWALSLINKKKLQTAINENDFDLAMENHAITEKIITELFEDKEPYELAEDDHVPVLTTSCFAPFRFFIEKGLHHWFQPDIIGNWKRFQTETTVNEGWEAWFNDIVVPQYKDAQRVLKTKKLAKA